MAGADSVIAALLGQGAPSFAPPMDAGGIPDVNVQPVTQNDFSGAFAGSGAASGQNFPMSLVQSESGGNWNALNSEGYGGRLQFGKDRLADAARAGVIPAGMTGAQFSQLPPEQQQAVEQWHFNDIDSQAERMGLNSFIGQNVAGIPITQDGIRAMAHLGGIGGAAKFLQSGGQYNPADSNGTSLADYAMKHGAGGGIAPIGGAGTPPATGVSPVVAALMQASNNPWVQQKYGPVIQALMGQEMQRQNATFEQQLRQQDPLNQVKLAQAQYDLEQDRLGLGGGASGVQSSEILDDGTVVTVMRNGTPRVVSPTGEVLTGQAAADAVKAARAYTVENQREIYGSRREGTLGADIALGGQAQGVKDVASATVDAGMSAWGDYGKLQSSLGNINEAIAALDNGAQSGMIYNMLPNVTEASASLTNAMNRMGLDVIGSVTFGALSEGEMHLAMDTAVPRSLGPKELREWLVRKRDAQQKAAEMLADAAQYLTVPGNTINGWIEQNRAARASETSSVQGQPASAPQPQGSDAGWQEINGVRIRRRN
ncbi:hypothetical protein [Paracoccus sp. (in: a-proteobacteria)]|uniref:hypothetical protein n=1 Tax=Paracoccus sp. TaxID=267 RepID=UPI0033424A11